MERSVLTLGDGPLRAAACSYWLAFWRTRLHRRVPAFPLAVPRFRTASIRQRRSPESFGPASPLPMTRDALAQAATAARCTREAKQGIRRRPSVVPQSAGYTNQSTDPPWRDCEEDRNGPASRRAGGEAS